MCVEVMEHIPEQHESTVLDNIVRPATEGIILSWATPGQDGWGHVNQKPPEYPVYVMKKRGLSLDWDATTKLRQSAFFSWLKRNIAVYRFASSWNDSFPARVTRFWFLHSGTLVQQGRRAESGAGVLGEIPTLGGHGPWRSRYVRTGYEKLGFSKEVFFKMFYYVFSFFFVLGH